MASRREKPVLDPEVAFEPPPVEVEVIIPPPPAFVETAKQLKAVDGIDTTFVPSPTLPTHSFVELAHVVIINGVKYGPGPTVVPTECFEVWRHAVGPYITGKVSKE